VLFALSIAAFPEELARETMSAIFAGAAATVREGGGVLAGGHTITDPEPKYGLAVIGVVHPDRILRKGGARPGDTLFLTKPLGTGILVSGDRSDRSAPEHLTAAVASMRHLNRAAADVLVESGVRGATDVTGFGLLGHATEMARGSGSRFIIEAGQLPALDGALELAGAGVETGGAAHNRRFTAPTLTIHEGIDPAREVLAFDPQTSGGLLAAVPNDRVATVVAGFGAADVSWWRVGRVESGEPGVELVA
jgi:selenide,water dikinase